MSKRNIIVIGASAGGFEAIKILVSSIPKDLDVSILGADDALEKPFKLKFFRDLISRHLNT